MNIGDKIKRERLRHHMSQDDIAKAIGSTKQAVYKYENGIVTNIPLDKIEIMAQLFGTTPAYLMGWEEKTSPTEVQLNEGEREILKVYRRASDNVKPVLIKVVESLEEMPIDKLKVVADLLSKQN